MFSRQARNRLVKYTKLFLLSSAGLGLIALVLAPYLFPDKLNENVKVGNVIFDIEYSSRVDPGSKNFFAIRVQNLNAVDVSTTLSLPTLNQTAFFPPLISHNETLVHFERALYDSTTGKKTKLIHKMGSDTIQMSNISALASIHFSVPYQVSETVKDGQIIFFPFFRVFTQDSNLDVRGKFSVLLNPIPVSKIASFISSTTGLVFGSIFGLLPAIISIIPGMLSYFHKKRIKSNPSR